ncbi:MAG: hypothetical protein A2Y41_11715 [Spirochaetes bacterium GWB1_36_13]|nr:MAG: hypothetical protein A2Y41_11715 [Spirochaetes bacterium GWB1_36_13]
MKKLKILLIDENNPFFDLKKYDLLSISGRRNSFIDAVFIGKKMPDAFIIANTLHFLLEPYSIPIYILADEILPFDKLRIESLGLNKIYLYSELPLIEEKLSEKKEGSELPEKVLEKLYDFLRNKEILDFPENYSKKMIKNTYLFKAFEKMDSLSECVYHIFEELKILISPDILIFFLEEEKKTAAFILIQQEISEKSYENFFKVAFHNHFSNFKNSDYEKIEKYFYFEKDMIYIDSLEKQEAFFEHLSSGRKKTVSSYYYNQIFNSENDIIGTLHIGSQINHFFTSDNILNILEDFSSKAGKIMGNAFNYQNAEKKKTEVKKVFQKFVPETIINQMFDKQEENEKGERREICVLFSDIRSFTTITEKNTAENVVQFLNNYFELMVGCIREEGGIIDKLIGDAVVALFGVNHAENPALQAVRAAIKMVGQLNKVDIEGLYLPDEKVNNGIGIHIGELILGKIGSNEKKAYTAVGDVVRIAEELEASTKNFHTPILFSQAVKEKLNNNTDSLYLGNIELEEKKFPVYTLPDIDKKNG